MSIFPALFLAFFVGHLPLNVASAGGPTRRTAMKAVGPTGGTCGRHARNSYSKTTLPHFAGGTLFPGQEISITKVIGIHFPSDNRLEIVTSEGDHNEYFLSGGTIALPSLKALSIWPPLHLCPQTGKGHRPSPFQGTAFHAFNLDDEFHKINPELVAYEVDAPSMAVLHSNGKPKQISVISHPTSEHTEEYPLLLAGEGENSVISMALSKTHVATLSNTHHLRVWSRRTKKLTMDHTREYLMTVSLDGSDNLYLGYRGGDVEIYHVVTGAPVNAINNGGIDANTIPHVKLGFDRIAVVQTSGYVSVYRGEPHGTLVQLATIPSITNAHALVTFSPNGSLITTEIKQGTLGIWKLAE